MKVEASELASVLFVTVSGWFGSLSREAKGVLLAFALVTAGASGGVAVYQQLALPNRVAQLESQYADLEDRVGSNERSARTQTLLLMRVLCRLDGNTANSCDLAYGGGQRIEDR